MFSHMYKFPVNNFTSVFKNYNKNNQNDIVFRNVYISLLFLTFYVKSISRQDNIFSICYR